MGDSLGHSADVLPGGWNHVAPRLQLVPGFQADPGSRPDEDFDGMVALIEETWREHHENLARRRVGSVGPGLVDDIASVLIASDYLNERAEALYNTDSRDKSSE
jgi:hypothetical protein